MPRLLIHVGHGKTGSSFIQSTFANSLDALRNQKIVYPMNTQMRQAAKGSISSGNAAILLDQPKLFKKYKIGPDESILISGEILFNKLFSKSTMKNIDYILREFKITEVKCLLFIRNPIEHAASFYQQLVKREGYTSPIESFFEIYKTPQVVSSFIKRVSRKENYSISVKNYSNLREDLNQEVANWLMVPVSSLTPPDIPIVNRSLTLGELEMQRQLNIHLGKSGRVIADKLCEQLPNIRSEILLADLDSQKSLLKRLESSMDDVNSQIDSRHHYDKEPLSPPTIPTEPLYKFSSEQIRVIVDGFNKELLRVKGNK